MLTFDNSYEQAQIKIICVSLFVFTVLLSGVYWSWRCFGELMKQFFLGTIRVHRDDDFLDLDNDDPRLRGRARSRTKHIKRGKLFALSPSTKELQRGIIDY
mmetsp:Transcript_13031/g.14439  ORF Transcript_13031/g.14439 Transcript_13031/m.14439 type:complete len:101 (+) Transcript_13031:108-410(+)